MAYRHQGSDNGTADDSEQKFSWLLEEHDEEHLAKLTKPKQQQQQQLTTTSNPNPFEDNNDNVDNDDEEAFSWDDSKLLMGTGRLLLQDPAQSPSSSPSPFPSQSSSASPPPPSRLILSVPLHPEPTSSSLLTQPTTTTSETGSESGAPANYGSLAINAPAVSNTIASNLEGDVGNPKLAFSTTDESTTENDDDDNDDPHETDPLQASSQPESTVNQQPPQRPCYLQIVYAFETFAMLASLAWWLTEILLPLLVLRSHALEETPIVTIVLLSYLSVLVLLLGLVESRRPCACCCGLLQSPVLQAPIYRGFWYSLVGCIGLNLANDEYQRQQQQQQQRFIHDPLEDSYHNTTATLSFSWFWQVSWSSWLFLQVLSSIMMILVGWIYILAGLLCFACGECFERSRTEHEEERNKFQKQQHQLQTQPQNGKAKSK